MQGQAGENMLICLMKYGFGFKRMKRDEKLTVGQLLEDRGKVSRHLGLKRNSGQELELASADLR
jgi:hypothetical protein